MAQVVNHQTPIAVGVLVLVRGEGVPQGVEPAVLDPGLAQKGDEASAKVGVVHRFAVGVGDAAVVALGLLGLHMLSHFQRRQT